VQHAAGGGATAQLVVNRQDRVDVIADDFPLRRGRELDLEPLPVPAAKPDHYRR
jgi:hypothetical protein